MPHSPNLRRTLWIVACLLPLVGGVAYVGQFAMSFPRWDQHETTIEAVEGMLDGDLTFATLAQSNYGHRIIPPLLTSALLAPLTDWNLIVEAYVGYTLLIGVYVSLVFTLRHVNTPRPWLAALVVSVVVFSLRQRTNLIWSFNALQWFYMEMFIALTGWAFITRRVGWVGLGLTALFTALTVSASGGGLALLPLVLVLMWHRGYRRSWHFVAWVGFAVLTFWLFSYGQAPGEDTVSPLQVQPVANFWFMTTWISSAFLPLPNTTPRIVHLLVAGAGVGLVALNAVLLIRTRGAGDRAVVWMAFLVGYALVSGVMTMLGRSDVWWAGAQSRLYSMSVFFWVAVGVSAVTVLDRWRGGLRWLNATALTLIVFGQVVVAVVQWTAPNPEGLVGNLRRERDERCYWTYLIDRSPTCLNTLDRWGISKLVPAWENLWERRLTVYAAYDDMNPVSAQMPDVYLPGEAVVVSGPQPYQQVRAVTFQDWRVPGRLMVEPPFAPFVQAVPPGDLLRIMAADVPANPALFESAGTVVAGDDPTAAMLADFAAFVRMEPRVWALRAASPDDFDAAYREVLAETHMPVPIAGVHWRTTGYEDVTLWLRQPTEAARFGDDFVLEDWRITTPTTVNACATLEVETIWRTDAPLPENYSLALVLADADGIGAARTDANPAGYTTGVLEPGVQYAGTNDLLVACETPPGDYNLLLGVYEPGTGAALPGAWADGRDGGDLLYLMGITVE